MTALAGKVAIITGAGHPKGVGYAVARKLIEQGAKVVLTDLAGEEQQLQSGVEVLKASGAEALGIVVDVTRREHIDACVKRTSETFGSVDILINNAGVGIGSAVYLELSDKDWEISYQVNLKGVADFCQAVLPGMLEQGEGVIVNNASLSGLGAVAAIPACYTATKFAVVGLSKQLAAELAPKNIRCNAVCPGSIDTQMRKNVMELIAKQHNISTEDAERMENEAIAMGRPARPEEVADAIVYLASPSSSYVTGIALPVAGGMSPGI